MDYFSNNILFLNNKKTFARQYRTLMFIIDHQKHGILRAACKLGFFRGTLLVALFIPTHSRQSRLP